jgi:hypothetical protein
LNSLDWREYLDSEAAATTAELRVRQEELETRLVHNSVHVLVAKVWALTAIVRSVRKEIEVNI